MEYVDFDIEVGLRAGEGYPVVVHSPAGEAQNLMRFPFDEPTLKSHLKDLQIALLRSGGVPRRSLPPEVAAVRNFGQQLFEALFAGEIRSRYDLSRQRAEHLQMVRQQETGLRLRLHLQPPELAVVPWEYLYDTRQREYICLSRHTPLVRYLNLPQELQPLKVKPPLRILGMIASPKDQPPLDIQREKDRMHEVLKDLEGDKLVEIKWLRGQTWEDLQQAMWPERGPWHIFHFIGHGGFNPHTEEGVLALANEQGTTHLLHATELGRLLADHKSLRLVVLNACEGARGNDLDLFSSTAATLAGRGIPAVLAMQEEITDLAALQCGRTFYHALAAAMPVDGAVAEARKAISLQVTNSLEWGTPVLYLRAQNSNLFDLPPRVQPPTLPLVPDASPSPLPPAPAPTKIEQPPPPVSPPPAYFPILLILSITQNEPPLRVPLRAEGLTIGREKGNDLVLPDSAISRRHLRFTWQGKAWHVQRLLDAQLLYVNGHQRDQAELLPGDQLVVGGTVLRFERADEQWHVSNLGTDEAPLLMTPEPVPHLTVSWLGGRFVAPLREGSITIGRAPESGLVIPAPAVSAHHAILYRANNGSYLIQDAGARNALSYQNRPIQQHHLQHGDRLTIGSQAAGQLVMLAYADPRQQRL